MVFAPFKADTDYFAADKQFMINLRVSELDGLLETLNARGIAVETKRRMGLDPRPATSHGSTIPRAMRSSCGSRRRIGAALRSSRPALRRGLADAVAQTRDGAAAPRRQAMRARRPVSPTRAAK